MKKTNLIRIFLLSIFILITVFVFWKLFTVWIFPDSTWKMKREEKLELTTDKPIMQKFRVDRDGFSGVELLFGRSQLTKINGEIILELFEENCSKKIVDGKLEPQSINADDSNLFKFKRISDSKNKTFCLSLKFKKDSATSKLPQVFINPNNLKENLGLTNASGQVVPDQSLAMRPGYQNATLEENIKELNQRISQYKPWFLKENYLSFIVFSFLILAFLLVAVLIIS